MALDLSTLKVETKPVHILSLTEVADVLREDLKYNFAEVNVDVTNCPDLSQPPFNLASSGIAGNPKVIQIGGLSYIFPNLRFDKIYDLKDVAKLVKMNGDAFIIGAGSGPHVHVGRMCEGIYNVKLSDKEIVQKSRSGTLDKNLKPLEDVLPINETTVSMLQNLFISQGKPGQVLRIHVKNRIGEKNFPTSIRNSLEEAFKGKLIVLGGTFLIKNGKATHHIIRGSWEVPIETEEQLAEILKHYDFSSPLVAVGTLATGDAGLSLSRQHFHSFSEHGEAGHYLYDSTPETIEYLGYFNIGQELYFIDRPETASSLTVENIK